MANTGLNWQPDTRKYLKKKEIIALKLAINMQKYRVLVDTLLLTGRRITEVLHLKADNIDFKKKRILWEIEKKGRERTDEYESMLQEMKFELGINSDMPLRQRSRLLVQATNLARRKFNVICTCKEGGDQFVFKKPPIMKYKPVGKMLLKKLRMYVNMNGIGLNEYIFRGSDNRLKHLSRKSSFWYLKNSAMKAGIDPTRVNNHSFRHTVAFKLADAGVPDAAIQEILDQTDRNTVAKYSKIIGEDVRKYIRKLEDL